ncbi:hypothetical protein [Paracoccus luteus]|uniref:hypothetical protein n=1 Tax=Paracoccus luteus TaxID=2508543 RepID=UPI00106FE65C|nr:hypothetical protein [Paracoccus luteus]
MPDLQGRLRGLVSGQEARDRATTIGLALTGAWLALVLIFWLAGPDGAPASGLARLMSAVGVILPVALIWMAVGLARAIADLRAEAQALRARVESMRAFSGDAPVPAPPPSAGVARAAARPAAATRAETRQSALPLDVPESPAVTPEELVAALNFPDGPDDVIAIEALKSALTDPEAARVIRAAQDVITLLADNGLYMDDLDPRPAAPEVWRRFAAGTRGPAVAALAGIADDDLIAAADALLKGDEVFRDAAHHFLRQYDRMLTRVADDLNDAGMAALADTRSGRAFVLLAQATGVARQQAL